MQTDLDYITHRISLMEIGLYTKITIFVKESISHDWFDIIFNSNYALRYVDGERLLIRNFLKSLVELPVFNSSIGNIPIEFTTFQDEGRYYIYCALNDLPFNEQEWFRTAYIKTNIFIATTIAINKSIQLVSRLFPETIHLPDNSIDKIFEKVEQCSVFRKDYYKVEQILKEHKIDRLYHSTATANIDSIKKHKGLLSIKRLQEQKCAVTFASSESSRFIDSQKGIADYVHLSFESYYPMMKKAVLNGTLSNYTMLIISPVVALLKDTMFTEMNLVTTNVMPTSEINVLERIPFGNFHNKHYWLLSENDKKSYMAEVLVKGCVPSNVIINWDTL